MNKKTYEDRIFNLNLENNLLKNFIKDEFRKQAYEEGDIVLESQYFGGQINKYLHLIKYSIVGVKVSYNVLHPTSVKVITEYMSRIIKENGELNPESKTFFRPDTHKKVATEKVRVLTRLQIKKLLNGGYNV